MNEILELSCTLPDSDLSALAARLGLTRDGLEELLAMESESDGEP